MKKTILIGIIFLLGKISIGQQYDCLKNFQFVSNHIKNNYPGFEDKVTPENFDNYLKF